MNSKNLSLTAAVLIALFQSAFAQAPNRAAVTQGISDRALLNPPTSQLEASGPNELLLAIEINGQSFVEPALLLQDPQGKLYASADDFKRWRLLPPAGKPLRYQDADYFGLNDYAGLQLNYDPVRLRLVMQAEASRFESSTQALEMAASKAPTLPSLGGFFNYELLGSYAASDTQGAGQFELGVFKGTGVGTMAFVAPVLGSNSRLVRLDTTWNSDDTTQRESWRFGDVINRAGAWGRSVRMGGIQFGSNFATQPGFISSPTQQAPGLATLPSTVDVYVNNALASRREVAPGPFSITNLPVMTGSGEVRLVVRDMLGREQVTTQPFYASAALLAAGLQDYSYEFGFLRENFGINSNDYGDWAAAATYRRGFSDRFTGEAHFEMQARQKAAGVSGLFLVPQAGIFNASLAASQSPEGNGQLAALGFERQSQGLSFALRSQWTSRDFAQFGSDASLPPPARQFSASAGYATKSMGSFGLSYLRQNLQDQSSIGITGASYSMSLQRYGTLTLSLIGTSGADSSTQMAMIWTLPLGANQGVSVTRNQSRSSTQGDTQDTVATYQKSAPAGVGSGYRLEVNDSGDARGGFSYQNNVGTYGLDAASSGGENALRASARGGVALLGGQTYFSRWVDDSFGVARVAGFPNVRVYADNQLVGLTNATGDAILPRLRPYERNRIRIDARDLPLNAQVDALSLEAVPYFRSGVLAAFPVRPAYGALFKVMLDNGQPLPAGSTVELRGDQTRFPVAHDGEVYVTGLATRNQLVARWKGQACEFDLRFEPGNDPLPDLGEFICKGVKP